MTNILLDVQSEVAKIEKGDLKDLSIIKLLVPETINITLELPRTLLQIKEGGKVRVIMCTDASIESEVDGLFLCTIYNVERLRRGKEEKGLVYGSIGGLQVRIEGKGLHRKVKVGDKLYLGLKIL
ncbi:MAG: DNA-directed RNA polymerase subunit G [Candidatus Nezhaarchaeales archaeon]